MLGLAALFAALGFWQMQRLDEKEAQVAAVAARGNLPPLLLPGVAAWEMLDVPELDFRPVTLTGRFRHDRAVLVFTSLADPKGQFGGTGYWVLTPFDLTEGGTVFVNRGFVPQDGSERFLNDPDGSQGEVTITGIARRPEAGGSFTPGSAVDKRIDWVRDPERLAHVAQLGDVPVLGIYVDEAAGPAGRLPQGGETVLEFSNRHLEYAITWFGFALLTPLMLAFWIYHQRRPAKQTNLP